MPTYTIRTHRSTQIICILLALLTSYVSFYLLLNLAWGIGFDFDNFPLFPIKPMDPITSAFYYGQRTNTSLFILDLPIFAICLYAWWVGAFHGHDVGVETSQEAQDRIARDFFAGRGQAADEARYGYHASLHRDYDDEDRRESERQARLASIPSLDEEKADADTAKLIAKTENEIKPKIIARVLSTYGEQEPISLMWKNLKSSEIKTFLKGLPGKARVEKLGGKEPNYMGGGLTPRRLVYFCEQAGIILDFSLERYNYGKLYEIQVFTEGVDGYKQYSGKLPYGLSFNDTLSDVERKIGKASESSWEKLFPGYEYRATYQGLGVEISYKSSKASYKSRKAPVHAPEKPNAKIRWIWIRADLF